jgi:hypothetical protein
MRFPNSSAEGVDMAQIANARIRGPISQNDQHSVMEFVINYTASFSSNELNQEFQDATRLLEKDDTDNDQITPYQSLRHSWRAVLPSIETSAASCFANG